MNERPKISDFDPAYIENLKKNLIPTLKRHKHWVRISDIAENTKLFVDAVTALGGRGYFDDEYGHLRVDFTFALDRIRYIHDWEAEFERS